MRSLPCLFLAALIATTATAQSFTWTGANSSDWFDSGNWIPNGVPGATASVTIPAATNDPVFWGSGTACASLLVHSGGNLDFSTSGTIPTVTVESGGTIRVNGQLTVSGDLTNRGRIEGRRSPDCVRLTGQGTVRGQLPGTEVRCTDRTLSDANVEGNLLHTAGTLRIDWANFQYPADFTGGQIAGTGRGFLILGSRVNWQTTCTAPPATIEVWGEWTSTSRFAAASGTVVFRGTGNVTCGGNFHNLRVSDGAIVLQSSCLVTGSAEINGTVNSSPSASLVCRPTVAGARVSGSGNVDELLLESDLTLTGVTVNRLLQINGSGTDVILSGTCRVRGNLDLADNAAFLQGAPGSLLAVDGDFICQGHYDFLGGLELLGNLRILPTATFTPIEGRIVFKGTRQVSITSTAFNNPRPYEVVIDPGASVTIESVEDIARLVVGGVVQVNPWTNTNTSPTRPFAREIAVAATGRFTYADTATPFRAGNLAVAGPTTIRGAVNEVTGNVDVRSQLTLDAGAQFILDGNGTASGTLPALTVRGGQRTFATATVAGALSHTGGTLRIASLDVASSAVFLGAGASGTGAASDQLTVRGNLRVGPACTMSVDAGELRVLADTLDCEGTLAVAAAARLRLGPVQRSTAAVQILPAGRLRLVGAPWRPAALFGTGAGAYDLAVAGRIEAADYEFRDMAAQGVRLLAGAVVGPAPLDLRGGVFGSGAPVAGSVLLDVARSAADPPLDLTGVVFDNWHGPATFNVRTRSNRPIRFPAANGNFFGAAHEDDPNNVIEWPAFRRTEARTEVQSRLGQVICKVTTEYEIDAQAFSVLRGDGPSGPFGVTVGGVFATGRPTTYEIVDRTAVPLRPYYYLAVEIHTRGVLRRHDVVPGRALARDFQNTRVVGATGYPDITAALQGVPSGTTILVEAGTYPAFEVLAPVTIVALDAGQVWIDATAAPVVVRDVVATGLDAGLYDIDIVGGATGGLAVHRCAVPVVLDRVTVAVPAAAPVGVDILDSPRVALQECAFGPALTRMTRSSAYAWSSAATVIQLQQSSRLTRAGGVIGLVTKDASSTEAPLAGPVPRLQCPLEMRDGAWMPFELTTGPGDFWVVYFAARAAWFDVGPFLPIDMVLALDPSGLNMLAQGFAPPTGRSEFRVPLRVVPEDWGVPIHLQMLALGTRNPPGRLSNVRRVVFTP